MNIHCIVTFTILLVVVQASFITAEIRWGSAFAYRNRYDNYDLPLIEIRQPKYFDVRTVDDDYIHSLRRLHLFEPFDHRPVIYLPRIHIVPDVYVEERHPYAYNQIEEPVNPPYISRLLTTLSVTYNTKILPVHDYSEETVADSLSSASEASPKEVVTNKDTPKKGTNAGSVKVVTPKPNIKTESVAKPKAETKAENIPKSENGDTIEPTEDSENNVEPVDEVIDDSEAVKTESETGSTDTEPEANDGDATTDADVPTA